MFDTEQWKAAVTADPTISRNGKARARWAGGFAGLAHDGLVTASLNEIGRAIGYSAKSGAAVNVIDRLEASGRLQRISRGHGASKYAPSVPSTYRLISATAAPAATTVIEFPTDRAGLLQLARDIGEALLAA